MHSVDTSASPKKRTVSRGISEDESLRSFIRESESSRHLTRSVSRTLRRRTDSQQSEQDIFMGLPEMLELQTSYDEVVQELRGLEVEREALLFQVDVLQDTLEGVEELLAEAQREAGQACLELDQEKEAKRKLESLVCSLMQEVQRLKQDEMIKAPPAEERRCDSGDGRTSEEGSVLNRLRNRVSQTLSHAPSLALDSLLSEDGVLQRNGQDLSLDRTGADADGPDADGPDADGPDADADSISAYEDASAETPEQEQLFPGHSSNSRVDAGETQEPRTPENCVVS